MLVVEGHAVVAEDQNASASPRARADRPLDARHPAGAKQDGFPNSQHIASL